MRSVIVVLSLWAGISVASEAAPTKFYKWVDSAGVTHYGETVPAEYAYKVKISQSRYEMVEVKLYKPADNMKKTEAVSPKED